MRLDPCGRVATVRGSLENSVGPSEEFLAGKIYLRCGGYWKLMTVGGYAIQIGGYVVLMSL